MNVRARIENRIPGLAALASLKQGLRFHLPHPAHRIPGLAALASLKQGLRFHLPHPAHRIPGLAALASFKQGKVELGAWHSKTGFRGLLP